jgi:hypothetical protein
LYYCSPPQIWVYGPYGAIIIIVNEKVSIKLLHCVMEGGNFQNVNMRHWKYALSGYEERPRKMPEKYTKGSKWAKRKQFSERIRKKESSNSWIPQKVHREV